MKRRNLVCQPAQEESTGNPFLLLPSELFDTIFTLKNSHMLPNVKVVNSFISLLVLHMVNRASYAQFVSFRKREVLCMLNKLAPTYEESLSWEIHDESIPIWSKISRLALCDDAYRQIIDEFFDKRPKYETSFVSFVMVSIKKRIHASHYKDMGIRMHYIRAHVDKMTRTQKRILSYHCAAMFRHNYDERTIIRYATLVAPLICTYVYNIQNRIAGDDDDCHYSIALDDDEKIKIDVRYLVPLSVPLKYSNNEMLYEVKNPRPTKTNAQEFMSNKLMGRDGLLAPALDVDSLLRYIHESNAFRKCLLESYQAIIPQKHVKRARHIVV